MKLFPAYFDRPVHMKFADQEEDETIELLLRRHFVTNVPWIFMVFVGLFIPIIVLNLSSLLSGFGVDKIPGNIILATVILWYLFLLAYAITKMLNWYFNIYIVTNKHVVDINFHNLLNRDFVEVRLDDIQSSKSHIKGVIGSLFHYGDVIIETAAERQHIDFLSVPKPDAVKERIQDLQEKEEGPSDVT